MNAIPIGVKGSFSIVVTPEHLANRFKNPALPPVLATPLIILFMENAALDAIHKYLPPGKSAVGTAVTIRHLAATPAGQHVTAEAVVTGVDDRRIVFEVTARDETRQIGRGTHERAIVDLDRLAQRLAAKASSAKRLSSSD